MQDQNMQDRNCRTKMSGPKLWDRKMNTRNVVSARCVCHVAYSATSCFSVIAILFYCDFHMLPVLWVTSCFHIMALWQVMRILPKWR